MSLNVFVRYPEPLSYVVRVLFVPGLAESGSKVTEPTSFIATQRPFKGESAS